jgi:hypothetical protein
VKRERNGPKLGLRRHRRAARESLRSIFVAWIAVLALVVQLASAVQTHAMASAGQAEAAAALGELKALLGPNVALCARDDASAPGSPSRDPHRCCDDCALRQLTGHSALAPAGHAVPTLVTRYAEPLSVPADARLAKARAVAAAQPRGPPISA